MTGGPGGRLVRRPARHERPAIDEAGLVAARHADRLLDAAHARSAPSAGSPTSSRCRTGCATTTRWRCGRRRPRCRAAYGVKDSIRDALPAELTEPFLDSIDRLIRELNRARG